MIRHGVPHKSRVSLRVYNAAERLVKGIVDQKKKAGYYTVKWDASRVKSGIYFIKFKAGDYKDTRKIVVR